LDDGDSEKRDSREVCAVEVFSTVDLLLLFSVDTELLRSLK